MSRPKSIRFAAIAREALACADAIVTRWLPGGKREGREWVARNPTRPDGKPGSFKVNLHSGLWGDFATGEKGGDLISLAAFIHHSDQREAALKIAAMLGIEPYE